MSSARARFILRIQIIAIIVFLFAAILMARLYFLQIVHGEKLSQRADRQYVRPNQNIYDRGSIFFEDKDGRLVSGATLKSGFTIAVNPSVLEDLQEVYGALSTIIDIDRDTFFSRAGKTDDPYEEIAKHVDSKDARAIENRGLSGVSIFKERWRFYPGDTLAAQMLGFVGFEGDSISGRYGLERYYDDVLVRDGSDLYINFFAALFANINKTIFEQGTVREGDVITSIEPSVQLFLENELEEIHTAWDSKTTAGVIINPNTGEIYALGVHPNFNVNEFQNEESVAVFSNPVVESVYEMGSIIKPLTMAAGLDMGAVTAETTYIDNGFVDVDDARISNFDGKGRGRVSMQEVLSQSLNTGAVFVVNKMGNERFGEYMKNYKLGQETGIDLPNESAGLVSNLDSPRDLEYATAAFGQGIAMTPISTIRALSVLANGGVLVTPHIAKKIKYTTGLFKNISFNDGERVLKKDTVEEITRMLVSVVDEALLGGTVKMEHYSIAAKTGTAQIAKVGERGYYEDRFLHSFFGYFPAYDPQFLIFLYTVEPRGVRYASQTLTYPFMDTVSFLINYYEIPPDR